MADFTSLAQQEEEVGISCNQSRLELSGGDYVLLTTCDNGEAYSDAYIGGKWYPE